MFRACTVTTARSYTSLPRHSSSKSHASSLFNSMLTTSTTVGLSVSIWASGTTSLILYPQRFLIPRLACSCVLRIHGQTSCGPLGSQCFSLNHSFSLSPSPSLSNTTSPSVPCTLCGKRTECLGKTRTPWSIFFCETALHFLSCEP